MALYVWCPTYSKESVFVGFWFLVWLSHYQKPTETRSHLNR